MAMAVKYTCSENGVRLLGDMVLNGVPVVILFKHIITEALLPMYAVVVVGDRSS